MEWNVIMIRLYYNISYIKLFYHIFQFYLRLYKTCNIIFFYYYFKSYYLYDVDNISILFSKIVYKIFILLHRTEVLLMTSSAGFIIVTAVTVLVASHKCKVIIYLYIRIPRIYLDTLFLLFTFIFTVHAWWNY
jgi:hypothetical protein